MGRKRITTDVRHVIDKHLAKNTGRYAVTEAWKGSSYLLLSICMADIALTGGLGSAAMAIYGALGTVGLAGHALLNRPMTDFNAAGQKVHYASPLVRDALVAMEKKLAVAYEAIDLARAPQTRLKAQDSFLRTAREFDRDRKTLSSAFEIVKGLPTDTYALTVKKTGTQVLTMGAAVLAVTGSMAPPPAPPPAHKEKDRRLPQPDDAVEKMKKRMDALEQSTRKNPPKGPAR